MPIHPHQLGFSIAKSSIYLFYSTEQNVYRRRRMPISSSSKPPQEIAVTLKLKHQKYLDQVDSAMIVSMVAAIHAGKPPLRSTIEELSPKKETYQEVQGMYDRSREISKSELDIDEILEDMHSMVFSDSDE